MRRPEELLYDSEACLRLIDHVIEEFGSSRAETTKLASICPVTELARQPTEGDDTNHLSIEGRGRAHQGVTR